jgi:alkaline phosphatase D
MRQAGHKRSEACARHSRCPDLGNPHIRYYEGDRRGYFLATVRRSVMQIDLRFVTSVEDANGTGYKEANWVIEVGAPGARPA